jgi:UDP-N-acetylglucosamine:LPS N-acetylglucosamine transferase
MKQNDSFLPAAIKDEECRVLYFSRGRGHGHAIPDMAIAARLSALSPNIRCDFVSYATGAHTFRASGVDVLDLGIPENNGFLDTLIKCLHAIQQHKPDVVVAHEEFAALSAAHMLGTPSIFISAWLPGIGTIGAESLMMANAVIVLGDPGVFSLPPAVQCPVFYTGHILRKMAHTLSDRVKLREEYGIPRDSTCIVVVPGGSATEAAHPIADSVLAAFESLEDASRRLFWVSSKDYEMMSVKFAGKEGVAALQFVSPIERLLACADVVITKGTRGITLDAASMGVPSISISNGSNPIDDILVPRIPTNVALRSSAVDGNVIRYYIRELLTQGAERIAVARVFAKTNGLERTVRCLRENLLELKSKASLSPR